MYLIEGLNVSVPTFMLFWIMTFTMNKVLSRAALHQGAARSRSVDPHQWRTAGQQLSAVADRVCRDLGDRYAVAGVSSPASAQRGR